MENLVKPERLEKAKDVAAAPWWQYWRIRGELYEAIAPCDQILVCARVSKLLIFSFVPNKYVFNEKLVIFPESNFIYFGFLQSEIHVHWAWQYSSTMRDAGINYSPTDVLETFPFPDLNPTTQQQLEAIGENYYNHRQKIMTETQLGLTKTYNRFHHPNKTDPEIEKLRQLHIEMDNAVAAAYGWEDLIAPLSKGGWGDKGLNHDFHQTKQGLRFTISEQNRREILDRLLQLNHQRYAEEEKQGLHDKAKKKATKTKKAIPQNPDQLGLNL